MKLIKSHRELDVYQLAFETAMKIFEVTKRFPKEERYSLTDQIRRSSRSICANIAEAWRKRIYPAAFVAKISDAEAEAGETQAWLELSLSCNYLEVGLQIELNNAYEKILGQLVNMRNNPKKWTIS